MEVLCKKEKCHRNQVENATGTKSLGVHRGWPRLTSRLQTPLPCRRHCCYSRSNDFVLLSCCLVWSFCLRSAASSALASFVRCCCWCTQGVPTNLTPKCNGFIIITFCPPPPTESQLGIKKSSLEFAAYNILPYRVGQQKRDLLNRTKSRRRHSLHMTCSWIWTILLVGSSRPN